MACLNIMDMFRGRKVKVEAAPKREPGQPKKPRLDFEAMPSEVECMALEGIEPSEAVGSHEMAVESAESAGVMVAVEPQEAAGPLAMLAVETQEAAGLLAMVAVETPAAKKLRSRQYGLMPSTALRELSTADLEVDRGSP